MTRNETKTILAFLDSLYTNFNVKDATATANAWATILADIPFKDVEKAVVAYVRSDKNGFPPVPGQLIAILNSQNNNDLSTEEAVTLVRKAVSNGIYESKEEFDKLPENVQRAVGTPENIRAWAIESTDSFESVTLSHFRRQYRAVMENVKTQACVNLSLGLSDQKLLS